MLSCACLVACTKPEPVQDPLNYLRIGVDPHVEAEVIVEDLRAHGFRIGRRIDERDYVAFGARQGADSTVRVVTSRGTALSIQVPDVRWPERLWVELAPGPRPDFDGDGRRDVVISIRERHRSCLAWAEVTEEGFVSAVFRPRKEWGDSPCVIEIDPKVPSVLLEISVPDSPVPGARVRIPVEAQDEGWKLGDSPRANAMWAEAIEQRQQALKKATVSGDTTSAARLAAEIEWLEQLRNAEQPVLEPAEDGEEAR